MSCSCGEEGCTVLCAVGIERCELYKMLGEGAKQTKQHRCPVCQCSIHGICGVSNPDESVNIVHSQICFVCYEKMQTPKPNPTTKTTTNEAVKKKNAPVRKKKPTKPKVAPKMKKCMVQQSKPSKVTKEKTPDQFLSQMVAYSMDPEKGENDWLINDKVVPIEALNRVDNELFLMGVVKKKIRKGNQYEISWSHTCMGNSLATLDLVLKGITKHAFLQGKHSGSLTTAVTSETFDLGAISKSLNSNIGDDFDLNRGVRPPFVESDVEDEEPEEEEPLEEVPADIHFIPELLDENKETTDVDISGMPWQLNGKLGAPVGVQDTQKTCLKEGMESNFLSPLSSFLSFLPLTFWKVYVFETNKNGQMKYEAKLKKTRENGEVCKARKWVDVSLNEFMTFLAILLAMSLRPTPGQRYTDRWKNQQWHPYTAWMQLAKFKQIRSALSMQQTTPGSLPEDSLFKVRPLLNIIKRTLGKYVDPGTDLSLDESSIACRSKYGRFLIAYNPSKPTGKYHFKFYVLTDTDYNIALRITMHTKTIIDEADADEVLMLKEKNL